MGLPCKPWLVLGVLLFTALWLIAWQVGKFLACEAVNSLSDGRGDFSSKTGAKRKKTCLFTISAFNNYGFVKSFLGRVEALHPEIGCFIWVVADNRRDERAIMLAGQFNFGFIALAKSAVSSEWLTLWIERLRYYGFASPSEGMHFDQNWGNFIPSYFAQDQYLILRDPRYNIAYWNLHYRGKHLHMVDDIVMYDSEPFGRLSIDVLQASGMRTTAILLPSGVKHNQNTSLVKATRIPTFYFNLFVANAVHTADIVNRYPTAEWKRHYNIAYWSWELDQFPSKWLGYMEVFSEIWTVSDFVTMSILSSPGYAGYVETPVMTMPMGLTLNVTMYKANRTRFNFRKGTMVFLVMFDFLSSYHRKNPLSALAAFRRAFQKSKSNVLLVIKCVLPLEHFSFQQEFNQLKMEVRKSRRVRIMTEVLSQQELGTLMASVDVFVSLHRSEGYGLLLLQMLMLGKPVIATAYSGNMDFMAKLPESFQFLQIPYRYTWVNVSEPFLETYQTGQRWAEPDVSKAAKAMQMLYAEPWPRSGFYFDPVVVLDFQSLYPSIIIAYNLCFSTCVGRLQEHLKGATAKLGVLEAYQQPHCRAEDLFVTPNEAIFLKRSKKAGILPRMLFEILQTRIMVKKALKELQKPGASAEARARLLDARQFGLKMIANVTYGYTGASFSGRMPCVDLADAIVQTARRTLERAIRWAIWQVLYGDTDSMFVRLPGHSKEEAFQVGAKIAQEVTKQNPRPVELQMEKVYWPCCLVSKKRYVGHAWSSPNDVAPVFDAKGIETIRRDQCAATQHLMRGALENFFESKGNLSQLKQFIRRHCRRIREGRFTVKDFIFHHEVRAPDEYKGQGPLAAQAVRRSGLPWPSPGERFSFVVAQGRRS
eukprot:g1154.t2